LRRALAGTAFALAVVACAVGTGTGCTSVDLGSPPADINACRPGQQFFIDQIWPNVLSKDYGGKHCYDSSCHDQASGRPLTLQVPTSTPMVPLPADWMADYLSASEEMQCSNAAASELVTRPDGERTHGGGMLFQQNGPEATLLEMWVTQP
jgi:hypothetical protein